MRRFISFVCILLGVFSLLYAGYLFWERTNPSRLSFSTPPPAYHATHQEAIPATVSISRAHINLPLYPAKNLWSTTAYGASFLTSTPLPGERGNSIVYAHNWTNLFGNLLLVKPGDDVTITYKNKTKKTFTVIYTDTVTPRDTRILDNSEDTRITLYTCTGFLDTKRFVVVAMLR